RSSGCTYSRWCAIGKVINVDRSTIIDRLGYAARGHSADRPLQRKDLLVQMAVTCIQVPGCMSLLPWPS
ncbi:hypothetical protein HETIRDRAFT_330764, partial [Heterobasidion irregulare TC 32-1]